MVPQSGIVPKKQLDDILLKTAQQSNKAKGAPAVGSAPSAAPSGAPADAGGQQTTPNDKNNDGKDDTTGKVIPMKKPAPGSSKATEIPPNIQQQLDALSPTEKKVLAGLI